MILSKKCIYEDGFFYEPLSEEVRKRIYGCSYREDSIIAYDELRYVSVLHTNFDGKTTVGELICNKALANDMLVIFRELYHAAYQIEKIRLIDDYLADDRASMADNNTSCFNYRVIAGTHTLSHHAYGAAIDVNPFYNPYCEPNGYISPPGSEVYADRSQTFLHKIDENDLCYQLFIAHGFIWGGAWEHCKDYQHFQKDLS